MGDLNRSICRASATARFAQIEGLAELKRLRLVLENLPDEPLMRALEAARGRRGRSDDCPVRAMWNALIAGVVFQHPTVESLLRELARNGQLRQVCGFWAGKHRALVPNSWAFSRLLASVIKQEDLLKGMFDALVEQMGEVLPDYGQHLAIDGKAVASYACGRSKGQREAATRGLTKMRVRCTLALAVMLAMALGRIRANQEKAMRSLLKPAA